MSRNKGHSWEREIGRDLRDVMKGAVVERGWQAAAGHTAPDVMAGGVFCIEAKHAKRIVPEKALFQAMRYSLAGEMPVAICREHGTGANKALVCCTMADLAELTAHYPADVYVRLLYPTWLGAVKSYWEWRTR